ncbi:unnamed protein product [Closterium sp. NIES-53]
MSDIPEASQKWSHSLSSSGPPGSCSELAVELALERISKVRDLVRCSTVSKAWADAVARSVLHVRVDCTSGGIFGPASIFDGSDDDEEFNNEYRSDGLTYKTFLQALRVFRQLTSLTVTSFHQAFGDAFLETLASSCPVLQVLDLSCMCYGEGDDEVTSSGLNSLFVKCLQLKRLSLQLGHDGNVGHISAKQKISKGTRAACGASAWSQRGHADVAWSESALTIPSSIMQLSSLEALEIQTDRCMDLGLDHHYHDQSSGRCSQCDSTTAMIIEHLCISCPSDASPHCRPFLPSSITHLQLSSSHHIILPNSSCGQLSYHSNHQCNYHSDSPDQAQVAALGSASPTIPQPTATIWLPGLKSVKLSVCCDVMFSKLASLFHQDLTSLSLSANRATMCDIWCHSSGSTNPSVASAKGSDEFGATGAANCKFGCPDQPCSSLVLPTILSISRFQISQTETDTEKPLVSMHPAPTFAFPATLTSSYSRLRSLHLDQCPDTALPPSLLPSLTRLTAFSFTHCRHLTTLPPTISFLSCLTSLHMHACHALDSLPPEALCLPGLRSLHLTNCRRLESVGKAVVSAGNVGVFGGGSGGDGCNGPVAIHEVVLQECVGLRYVNWEVLLGKTVQVSPDVAVEVNVEGCSELRGIDGVMRMMGCSSGRIILPNGAKWYSQRRSKCRSKSPPEMSGGMDRCVVIQI